MAIVDFDTECWDDPWLQKRTPLAKLLFIYLWTNSHRNISGLYIITKKTMVDETALTEKQVDHALKELGPKISYDSAKSVCLVIKHVRRQFLRRFGKLSPPVRAGIRKAALKLKHHPYFLTFAKEYPEVFDSEELDTLSIQYQYSIDTIREGVRDLSSLFDSLVVKEKNNSPNPEKDPPEPETDALKLSKLLFSLFKERDEKAKEPNFQTWAIHIDRLIRIDQRTPEEIEAVIRWCQANEFWQNNILSTEKLRDQFTQLILKMNKTTGKQPEDAFDKKLARIKNMVGKKDDRGG
jgi:hypothetical protein